MKTQEPKQIKCYCGHTTMCDCGEEPKQQTKMTYKEYIDLGFTRTELDCKVTELESGYGGFALTKNINGSKLMIEVTNDKLNSPKLYIRKGDGDSYHNGSKLMIEVTNDELNSPKLYICKGDGDSYHIFKITPEAVKDLLNNNPR